MLGDPHTTRVTGDSTAAVFRRKEDKDAEHRPEDYADKSVPEAYCWSNLTSGNGSRALWLILLPFMVVNLAHWTRPAADGRRGAVRLHGLLVRLIALSLTVLLTAAACEVALDLAAWQCAGEARCAEEHSWLAFMAVPGSGSGGWWSQPGRRLALATALPAHAAPCCCGGSPTAPGAPTNPSRRSSPPSPRTPPAPTAARRCRCPGSGTGSGTSPGCARRTRRRPS